MYKRQVKIAVDMLHYNVPEAQRDNAFRQGYQRLVIAQFGSGVDDEIKEQIFGVPDPPATIAAVLAAATAVENKKHSKVSKLIVNQVEDEKKPKEEDKSDSSELEMKCEKLEKQMKEILAIGRGSYRG